MPTRNQDGELSEVETVKVFGGETVRSIEVRHNEVVFLDVDGKPKFQVVKPGHPGAGLHLSIADDVATDL